MGIDVHLYTKAQREANAAHDRMWDDWYALWGDQPDSDEKTLSRATVPDYQSQTNVPSERYPEHLFNRRYLRSSYNGGGFNNAAPSLIGADHGLYWIFEPMGREWDGDEGTLTADDLDKLAASKARALQVADELRKSDRLRVLSVAPNMFLEPPTADEDQALAMYREKVVAGRISPEGWWSNRDMNVYGDGLTVLAAIPGTTTFGIPGVHLIYRQGDEGFVSYISSAEITAEFCDEAMALIRADGGCSMHWSG